MSLGHHSKQWPDSHQLCISAANIPFTHLSPGANCFLPPLAYSFRPLPLDSDKGASGWRSAFVGGDVAMSDTEWAPSLGPSANRHENGPRRQPLIRWSQVKTNSWTSCRLHHWSKLFQSGAGRTGVTELLIRFALQQSLPNEKAPPSE